MGVGGVYLCRVHLQGQIQKLKKGGHTLSGFEPAMCRTDCAFFFFFFFFFYAHMTHSVNIYGGLGAYCPRKVLKFRPYKSASEAIGDHHIFAKFVATGLNSGDSLYGRFSEPLPACKTV